MQLLGDLMVVLCLFFQAYKTLKNKVEGLKTLLAIHQITINDTGKIQVLVIC